MCERFEIPLGARVRDKGIPCLQYWAPEGLWACRGGHGSALGWQGRQEWGCEITAAATVHTDLSSTLELAGPRWPCGAACMGWVTEAAQVC